MEYIFHSRGDGSYMISKFDDGPQPLETYTVAMDQPKRPCDCGAWRSRKTQPCKHSAMIQAWIDAGKPEAGSYTCIGVGKEWTFEKLVDVDERILGEDDDEPLGYKGDEDHD